MSWLDNISGANWFNRIYDGAKQGVANFHNAIADAVPPTNAFQTYQDAKMRGQYNTQDLNDAEGNVARYHNPNPVPFNPNAPQPQKLPEPNWYMGEASLGGQYPIFNAFNLVPPKDNSSGAAPVTAAAPTPSDVAPASQTPMQGAVITGGQVAPEAAPPPIPEVSQSGIDRNYSTEAPVIKQLYGTQAHHANPTTWQDKVKSFMFGERPESGNYEDWRNIKVGFIPAMLGGASEALGMQNHYINEINTQRKNAMAAADHDNTQNRALMTDTASARANNAQARVANETADWIAPINRATLEAKGIENQSAQLDLNNKPTSIALDNRYKTSQIRGMDANSGYQEAQTAEVHPNAVSARAVDTQNISASKASEGLTKANTAATNENTRQSKDLYDNYGGGVAATGTQNTDGNETSYTLDKKGARHDIGSGKSNAIIGQQLSTAASIYNTQANNQTKETIAENKAYTVTNKKTGKQELDPNIYSPSQIRQAHTQKSLGDMIGDNPKRAPADVRTEYAQKRPKVLDAMQGLTSMSQYSSRVYHQAEALTKRYGAGVNPMGLLERGLSKINGDPNWVELQSDLTYLSASMRMALKNKMNSGNFTDKDAQAIEELSAGKGWTPNSLRFIQTMAARANRTSMDSFRPLDTPAGHMARDLNPDWLFENQLPKEYITYNRAAEILRNKKGNK